LSHRLANRRGLWRTDDDASGIQAYAAECLQAAKFTMSPEVRMTLISMAQRWNDPADRAERNAHLRGPE
jgi:hypothetical protein